MRREESSWQSRPTCEVLETQLSQAKVAISAIIEEDGQGVTVLIQLGAPYDA